MAELLPQPFVRFTRDYAAVARAYDALGKVCAETGRRLPDHGGGVHMGG